MSRGQPLRWESSELVQVLTFLNVDFDTWYTNHLNACNKIIEATNSPRDAKSIYNKVHSMIKAMDEFRTTGKKAQTSTIIWEDKTIQELVSRLYEKTKERKKKDKKPEIDSDSDVEMTLKYVDFNHQFFKILLIIYCIFTF